jgi:NTP-dependent ternary system trypsin peptidase co-occuring protein
MVVAVAGSTSSSPVKVSLPDGSIFQVQVRDAGGKAQVGIGILAFSDLTKSIEGISASLMDTVKKVGPSKVAIEFGIEASIEAGKLVALLCNGETTANLKITLEWESKKA